MVGCGRWGSLVVRDLVALGVSTHVVARSAESRGRAEEAGASEVVGDVRDLTGMRGFVVLTPTATRPEIIKEVLGRGVPVFTEKPLALDVRDARALAAAADGRLFVMDKWRYHPAVACLSELARSGELGAPLGLHCRRLSTGNPRGEDDGVANLLPHDLAIAQEVLGELPPAVSARGYGEGDALDGLVAVLGTEPWLAVEVSARWPEHIREVTLHLRLGSARMVGDAQYVEVISADGARAERRPVTGEPPLRAELRAFVEHLEGGPSPKSGAAPAADAVAVTAQLRAMAAQARSAA